ncbi:hypothetical protein CRG98_042356 [Punica granatum]|uniref:RNase H type-1 domain-containing protein n=1 Tax=Punica granatum TaxID=22663 RepID=A0A2I0HZW0_PUNGR|nr:hypothetical protein CRG98_042356 [Punica granatum]
MDYIEKGRGVGWLGSGAINSYSTQASLDRIRVRALLLALQIASAAPWPLNLLEIHDLPEHGGTLVGEDRIMFGTSSTRTALLKATGVLLELGGLICDEQGLWFNGFAQNIGIATSVAAELRAGLELAWELGVGKLPLEVDSEVVVPLIGAL